MAEVLNGIETPQPRTPNPRTPRMASFKKCRFNLHRLVERVHAECLEGRVEQRVAEDTRSLSYRKEYPCIVNEEHSPFW